MRRDADPNAVLFLADSAYVRSINNDEIGFAMPVPQKKNGVLQKVMVFKFFFYQR